MDRETRTILLVDNSASMLFYLGMLLKKLEYRVVTARTAIDALRIMGASVPSIVITDTSLPGLDGINLLRRIKETVQYKGVPVVILTSETDPGLKDTCFQIGCAAYLKKPIEPDVLYRELQAVSESIPRKNIRLTTSIEVLVGECTAPGGTARTEYATALSEGGAFIRMASPLPQGACVPLTLLLPGRNITVKAIVLYSSPLEEGSFHEPGMGMKFTEILPIDRDFVRHFISEQLTRDISAEARNGQV